ncbi:MAG: peptidoglycan editing factor PgeF [Pseudomonadota bacterium]
MTDIGIKPAWPAPPAVHALTTTRQGGVSTGAWFSLNLADHVGDDPGHVAQNRTRLIDALQLPSAPLWLQQVHGTRVIDAGNAASVPEADATYTTRTGVVCTVLTADCLPVLLCDRAGSRVAAAHAGWRGLVAGVLEATVAAMAVPADSLLAWFGPAISAPAYIVGDEVREAFMAQAAESAAAFQPAVDGDWHADLYALARQRLAAVGVSAIFGGDRCSLREPDSFYSYRRDGAATGRMASLIWLGNGQERVIPSDR